MKTFFVIFAFALFLRPVFGQSEFDEFQSHYASAQVKGWAVDPWRVINRKTNQVSQAAGWVKWSGEITQVLPDGVLVNGAWGDRPYNEDGEAFFVANFPYQVAEGETIMPLDFYTAYPAGMYSYTTVLGASRTIHKLDYGIVWKSAPPKPLTPEQIVAANADIERRKKAAQAAVLKYNQDLAAKGDAYGLFRMGERYRDGDGVEKDPSKAKDYFQKSAAAGEPSAALALKNLTNSIP